DNDAILSVAVSGGCAPYTYEWSVGVTTPNCPGLGAGLYEITVTDCLGCAIVSSFIIVEPEPLIAIANTFCSLNDPPTGSIDVQISGGTLPYTYAWSDNNTVEDLTGLAPGIYVLTITDANDCIFILNEEVGLIDASLDTDTLYGAPGDLVQVGFTFDSNLSFEWFSSPDLSCDFCPNPIITLSTSQSYELFVSDIGSVGCTTRTEVVTLVDEDFVWPGDTDTNGIVNHLDLLPLGLAYDSTGPIRPGASLNWTPQIAPNWSQSTPNTGINFKHSDTNGNGEVSMDDTLAIQQNWGLMHQFMEDIEASRFQTLPTTNGRSIGSIYIEVDTFSAGQAVRLPIILGDNGNPTDPIYGIAFSIYFDSSLVEPGTAGVDFNNSWLGTYQSDLLGIQRAIYSPGRVDVAMTRINGQDQSGQGTIAELFITIEDDILLLENPNRGNENLALELDIRDIRLINFAEEELPITAASSTAIIQNNTTSTTSPLAQNIKLYPNPAKDQIWLESSPGPKQIRLIDRMGKVWIERLEQGAKTSLDIQALAPGLYWLEVQMDGEKWVEKVVVY
ncbi:MAG: T9SS type A sorting domain-containing protein, partial [Bacteroidota bacterium]